MFEAQSINAEHKDLIHDVAYDFYGQRMATCSSDQFVKVKKGLSFDPTARRISLLSLIGNVPRT